MRSFKALIFDMDGLVLDSEATYRAAWQLACEQMGYRLPEVFWLGLSGQPGDIVLQQLSKVCGGDFNISKFQQLSAESWCLQVQQQGIPVKKGFFSLLQYLRQQGLPFGLATNSHRREAENCLALAGLDQVFSILIARDQVSQPKPAPDLFLQAAAQLGVAAVDCLVLEDSAVGIAAAVAAKMPCVYIPSCLPADDSAARQALAVLADLGQVAGVLRRCGTE